MGNVETRTAAFRENGQRTRKLVPTGRLSRRLWFVGLFAAMLVCFTACRKDDPISNVQERSVRSGKSDSTTGAANVDAAPFFRDATQRAGIEFVHEPGQSDDFYFPEVMAGGAALLDFDQDGDLDIYFVNGDTRPRDGGAKRFKNRLYEQRPDKTFVDVTQRSGLDHEEYGMGVAVGDIDNDGFPDLYLSSFGRGRLYRNQRDGTFRDVTKESGIETDRWGASACFLDYDRDGWLDLFVTNYVNYLASRPCPGRDNKRDYCSPSAFESTPDVLFRNCSGDPPSNDTAGTESSKIAFKNVSLESGIGLKRGPGLGVLAADFNDDGWTDIYVANDGQPNFLWLNQQNGTFRDDAIVMGCAVDQLGRSQAGMGLAIGDVNHDGFLDLFVTNLDGETNAMYVSEGGGLFNESAMKWGLGERSLPFTGFGTSLVDLDHDGEEDVLVVNGRVTRRKSDREQVASFWSQYAERNHIYHRDGPRFSFVTSSQDPFLSEAGVSRSLCVGDIDNDGDMDALVVNIAGLARLYENVAEKHGHFLSVRVVEPLLGGRDAYGAKVTVEAGGKRWVRHVAPGASYLSSNDPRLHFGLGDVSAIDRLEVRWPDGSSEAFPVNEVDQFVVFEHGLGERIAEVVP